MTVLLHAVAARHPLGVLGVTTLLEEKIGTNGIMIAMTANTIAAIETMTDETVTMTVVIATVNALATVLAVLMRGTVTSRMIENAVMRIVSAEMTRLRMHQMETIEKVCIPMRTFTINSSSLIVAVSLDPMTSAHDELDTAE